AASDDLSGKVGGKQDAVRTPHIEAQHEPSTAIEVHKGGPSAPAGRRIEVLPLAHQPFIEELINDATDRSARESSALGDGYARDRAARADAVEDRTPIQLSHEVKVGAVCTAVSAAFRSAQGTRPRSVARRIVPHTPA